MRSITSQNGQNIWDIALMHMGSADAIFEILKLNPTLRIDSTIEANTEVFIPDKAASQRVCDYYAAGNINPATGLSDLPSPYTPRFESGKWINFDSWFRRMSIGIFPMACYHDGEIDKYTTGEISLDGIIDQEADMLLLYIDGFPSVGQPLISILNLSPTNEWVNCNLLYSPGYGLSTVIFYPTKLKLVAEDIFMFYNDIAVMTIIDVMV
jgi:hypothetical protein